MELYVSRSGSVEGPYSRDKIEAMIQQGKLAPTDLGALPGASDWSPLSQLLAPTAPTAAAPPKLVIPPPLQTAQPTIDLDQQFMIDGQIPSGTHGKSAREVVEELAVGGRLVVFQYVFSLLVITFRRNTAIHFIPAGKTGAGPAFLWSIITMLFGWWGFPWGFIYTPAALWRNTAGGVDVTEPVLALMIDPMQADAVVRRRPKPKGALWGLRALFLSPLFLLPMLVVGLAMSGAKDQRELEKKPEYRQFRQAERFLTRSKPPRGRGNSPAASKAAVTLATFLNEVRESAVTQSEPSEQSEKPKIMTIWCEQQGDRCLFIIGVPDLHRYSDKAKASLADAAWFAAQLSAVNLKLPAEAELAVAIRGALLYDRVTIGNLIPDLSPGSPEIETLLKQSISETDTSSTQDDRLMPYFFADEKAADRLKK